MQLFNTLFSAWKSSLSALMERVVSARKAILVQSDFPISDPIISPVTKMRMKKTSRHFSLLCVNQSMIALCRGKSFFERLYDFFPLQHCKLKVERARTWPSDDFLGDKQSVDLQNVESRVDCRRSYGRIQGKLWKETTYLAFHNSTFPLLTFEVGSGCDAVGGLVGFIDLSALKG